MKTKDIKRDAPELIRCECCGKYFPKHLLEICYLGYVCYKCNDIPEFKNFYLNDDL